MQVYRKRVSPMDGDAPEPHVGDAEADTPFLVTEAELQERKKRRRKAEQAAG